MNKTNLYGIGTDADYPRELGASTGTRSHRSKQDEQRDGQRHQVALKDYYRIGHGNGSDSQMSDVEGRFFFPAAQEAYVKSPKLSSRQTLNEGLLNIDSSLRYYKLRES
jgi:hypothetical protein